MISLAVATFAIMKRFLGITFLLAMAFAVCGQNTGNPFDLKFRPVQPRPETPFTPPATPKDTLSKPYGSRPNATADIIKPQEDSLATSPQELTEDTHRTFDPSNPFELSIEMDTQPAQSSLKIDSVKESTPKPAIAPPVFKTKSSRGFQIFFLLLSLLLLIFIVNVERSFVRDLWRVITNTNYSSLHHRNQRNTMRQILLVMGYTVFVIQAGLFIYHALGVFNYRGTLFDNVWTPIALVLCVYLIRHSCIRYLRWLFNNEKELTLFGFDISIFNTMVGLILLPVNVLMIFGPDEMHKPLVIIGVMVIAIAYFTRQLRWLLSAHQLIANSLFLFFVYLCAVEILPLWAISKLFW